MDASDESDKHRGSTKRQYIVATLTVFVIGMLAITFDRDSSTEVVTLCSLSLYIIKSQIDYRHEANSRFDALLTVTGQSEKAKGVLEEKNRQESKDA